jgi:phage host-nuclease inhibitor protein Gam
VAALKELPQLARYVRVREDVNRQALLADRQEIDAALLERAGLRVEQGEIFFVEPKLDSI